MLAGVGCNVAQEPWEEGTLRRALHRKPGQIKCPDHNAGNISVVGLGDGA